MKNRIELTVHTSAKNERRCVQINAEANFVDIIEEGS